MNYGERLKAARSHKGLTQKELGAATNGEVKQASISKIERGDQDFSGFDILLAMALDVHPKWLKDGDPAYLPDWLGGPFKSPESPVLPVETQELLTVYKALLPRYRNQWLEQGHDLAALSDEARQAVKEADNERERERAKTTRAPPIKDNLP